MAKTFTAPFAQTTKVGTAVVTLAGTIIDDEPTNTELIATVGEDGALLTSLTAIPRATATASALYLFISQDGGVTKRLVDSALMKAHTVEATTAIPVTKFENISEITPIRLEAGDELYVSSGVALADGIVFTAQWMEY